MKANLVRIIGAAQARKARVSSPACACRQLRPRYTQAFQQAFAEVAKERRAAYVPFLLDGIATTAISSLPTRSTRARRPADHPRDGVEGAGALLKR